MKKTFFLSCIFYFLIISSTLYGNFAIKNRKDRMIISFDLITRDMSYIEEPEGVHSASIKHYGIDEYKFRFTVRK